MNETLNERWSHWDLENGYHQGFLSSTDSGPDTGSSNSHRRRRRAAGDLSDEVIPLRGIAPGRSMGLSVMLNVKVFER